MQISDRKLKKAEQDITRIVNELLKPHRGLNGLEPNIKISFYSNNEGAEILYPKIDADAVLFNSSGWKTIISGKFELTVFKP